MENFKNFKEWLNEHHSLNEMATIGTIGGQRKGIKIKIYSSEGDIPHMHLEKAGEFESCVKLKECDYFNHKNYHVKLPSGIPERLDAELRKQYKNSKLTVWEFCILTWNANNPEKRKQLDINLSQPDYTKLSTE